MVRYARRRVLLVAALGCVAVMMIGSPMVAQAETWNFDVTFTGPAITDADVWAFSPAPESLSDFDTPVVAAGWPQYEWSFDITEVHLQLAAILWSPTGATYDAAGTHVGPLPFDLANEVIDESNPDPDGPILKTNLHLHITDDGKGHFDLTGIEWGNYRMTGGGLYPVTGLAVVGSMTVTGVIPEPTGIILLLSGALPLGLIALRRRRR